MTKEWFTYWLHAVDRHSLQAPFIFNFHDQFIRNKNIDIIPEIESIRKELIKNKKLISLTDFGAGSVINNQQKRSISYIAKTSASNPRFSILLKELIETYNFNKVLELGTSLGLNTMYMASANQDGLKIHTIEGSNEIAELAKSNFDQSAKKNIELHIGNIDQLLNPVLDKMGSVDLAYLDANHTYDATIRYFKEILPKVTENSIILIDDIHWSPEMKQAWDELRNHPAVTLSADIYDAGILFFKKELQKQHYIIEF